MTSPTKIIFRHLEAFAVLRVELAEPRAELLDQFVFFGQNWVAYELLVVPENKLLKKLKFYVNKSIDLPNHDISRHVYAFCDDGELDEPRKQPGSVEVVTQLLL